MSREESLLAFLFDERSGILALEGTLSLGSYSLFLYLSSKTFEKIGDLEQFFRLMKVEVINKSSLEK